MNITARVWSEEPTLIDQWPEQFPYLMSVDESGTETTKAIRKALARGDVSQVDKSDRLLTIAGAILERNSFPGFQQGMVTLKKTHWPPDGMFSYKGESKRVCFHSTCIRKKEAAFASPGLAHGNFVDDLAMFLRDVPATIISATVDKVKQVQIQPDPEHPMGHPYGLALVFLLERYGFFLKAKEAPGLVLLESRGRNEDRFALRVIMNTLTNGTRYLRPNHFSRIGGVYFAPKWHPDNSAASFVTLELADLFCYPIHQYFRDGVKSKPWAIIEPKLYHYPDYIGYGLKRFP